MQEKTNTNNKKQWGVYQEISKLGLGGMSVVYKVINVENGKEYAVKMPLSPKNDISNYTTRLENEIKVLKNVNSKYVIKIVDYKVTQDTQYIVMEYFDGISIDDWIEQNNQKPLNEIMGVMIQIVKGLKSMHDNGNIHRDIKPSNILINKNNDVKIIDLGISISPDTSNITTDDSVIGSVYFLSPEHLDGCKGNELTDIYALGILFYKIIDGKLPYSIDKNSNNTVDILKSLKGLTPPKLAEKHNLPNKIDSIIQKMTHQNPKYRYQSMGDILSDLESFSNLKTEEIKIHYDRKKLKWFKRLFKRK